MSFHDNPPLQQPYPDIVTTRLKLVWMREDMLRALIAGPEAFTALTGWGVAEAYMDFPGALEYSLDQWVTGAADPEYWMYLALLPARPGSPAEVIGLIGYKGGPGQSADGSVEIGYSIAPEHQSRGYATEAAEALVSRTLADPAVRAVEACTLAERNASCRVLEKNGFTISEIINDPHEGSLWKWRRKV